MEGYIEREITKEIVAVQPFYPVTLVTGARQVGKSTLCRHIFKNYKFVNLENVDFRLLADSDPNAFLDYLGDTAIIDEVQNCPGIFSAIQARVDADKKLRYILTGSCNFKLIESSCQSMAGRVAAFVLPPLSFRELDTEDRNVGVDDMMINGFYPGVICDGIEPRIFYRNYYNTYIERDVRNVLKIGNLLKFDTFMRLMAGRAGSEFRATSLSTEVGVSSTTISEWLSILAAAYIVFPLPPYHANISKRLTKMPKYYFYDTGLMCYLLGIENRGQLDVHPLRGAIFENMVVSELVKKRINEVRPMNLFFYREYSGREVDVLQERPDGFNLYEIKAAKTFHPEFKRNLEYVEKLFPDKKIDSKVIYNGKSIPPNILNVNDI